MQEEQKIHIAALLTRKLPVSGPLNAPQPSFPLNPPKMIARAVNAQTRARRRLRVVRGKARPLPSTFLRPAPPDSDNEEMPEDEAFDLGIPEFVEFITPIVEGVVKKMGITAVVVSKLPKVGRAKRAPSKRSRDVQLQKSKMTREDDAVYKVRNSPSVRISI